MIDTCDASDVVRDVTREPFFARIDMPVNPYNISLFQPAEYCE